MLVKLTREMAWFGVAAQRRSLADGKLLRFQQLFGVADAHHYNVFLWRRAEFVQKQPSEIHFAYAAKLTGNKK